MELITWLHYPQTGYMPAKYVTTYCGWVNITAVTALYCVYKFSNCNYPSQTAVCIMERTAIYLFHLQVVDLHIKIPPGHYIASYMLQCSLSEVYGCIPYGGVILNTIISNGFIHNSHYSLIAWYNLAPVLF